MNKPLRILFAMLTACFFMPETSHAQSVDTGRHAFMLGQVTITGALDSLRSDNLNAATISLYNRLDVSHTLSLLPALRLPQSVRGMNQR